MKIICPVCEKVVSGYVPRGGDGSAYRPYRHGDCEGRFELVTEIVQEASPTPGAADKVVIVAPRVALEQEQ